MSKLLWKPSEVQIKQSNMYRFMAVVNQKYNQDFKEYGPLYEWSIENIADQVPDSILQKIFCATAMTDPR